MGRQYRPELFLGDWSWVWELPSRWRTREVPEGDRSKDQENPVFTHGQGSSASNGKGDAAEGAIAKGVLDEITQFITLLGMTSTRNGSDNPLGRSRSSIDAANPLAAVHSLGIWATKGGTAILELVKLQCFTGSAEVVHARPIPAIQSTQIFSRLLFVP
jgi:hypothetical protein